MHVKSTAIVLFLAVATLAGCNDTLDSFDPSKISNKVEQPLPSKILAAMKAKGMERNSPIMIRVFKEEGVLEIWKAKTNNRFDKIAEYEICAWSGKLGPKVKEGDRQAPEGYYPLTPYHLNPNSKYFLAINTGYPNRFDQANGRTGSNLMIHGACSSSGCYSMTDAQIMEIYAFARDAFKGGQQTVQLQAFPFRMTAENMARHRLSPHYDFWKMLKVGYDNFEVTKRPPEVAVCGRQYVFNQQVEGNATVNAAAACPPMSTPPALASALASYNVSYERDYAKALNKYKGKAWVDPSEAERKALVAAKRKAKASDLAYAPTGSALKAGRLVSIDEFEAMSSDQPAATQTPPVPAATAQSAPASPAVAPTTTATVPVPVPNPQTEAAEQPAARKPFWKLWSSQ
ncbi:L,D-transpeptidase family protein [Agrobacterium sp. ES01]|uniref:L,D-transpeptidase family protein n=1 Tax=Agrobacterium sp. ES01 TaxID=3420714 RepID=UPI003D0B65A0